MDQKKFGYLMLIIFFLGGALKDVILKLVMQELDPLRTSAVLALITSISSFIFFYFKQMVSKRKTTPKRWPFKHYFLLFCLGITTAFAVYLGNLAINLVGPLTSKCLQVIAYPLFLSLISFIAIREIIAKKDIIATLISVAGFFVFYLEQLSDLAWLLPGLAAAAGASLAYAISLTIGKALLERGILPELIVAGRFLPLGLLTFFLFPGTGIWQSLPTNTVWTILLLGVFAYAGLFIIMFYGIREIPATAVSAFFAAMPIFTALFSWLLIPGTMFTLIELGGLAVIVIGLFFAVFYDDFHTKRVRETA
jgi:drug/metabolite transporter (DMT)-like permease